MKNPGKIVSWTDKDGNEQMGIAHNKNQSPQMMGRLLIHQINDDYSYKKNGEGKNLCTVKHAKEVKFIGFSD